jgi:hypothetical protein
LPLQVPAGELWIVHKNGQFIKWTNDGKLTASDAHGATIEFDGAGNLNSAANTWTHTGNVIIDGDLNVTQTGTADIDWVVDGVSLKGHTHNVNAVQPGSSTLPTTVPL